MSAPHAAIGNDAWFDRLFRLDGLAVLVVGDEAGIRDLIVAVLEACGAVVNAVPDAVSALDALQRELPGVLVTDAAMPGRDGYWLIGQVRALSAAQGGLTPAAAVTNVATPEERAALLDAGFQFHVPRPIDPGRLAGVVALLRQKD
jgi:CheY-like chemotaxis protein